MLPNVKKTKTTIGILAVFSALTLSACSGGGGGSSGSSGGSGSSATELKPGVYDIGTEYSGGGKNEGISLLSSTGKFVSVFDERSDLKAITSGNIDFSPSGKISGDVVDYQLKTRSGETSWRSILGTLSGQVVSSERADLTASTNGKVSSISVLLRRPGFSDLGVTKKKIEKTYFMSDLNNSVTINIDSEGAIIGNDSKGCIFDGKVVIPDNTINVFEVTYEAENCEELPSEGAPPEDRNGTYSGLGTFDHSDSKLIFFSGNDKVAWIFEGT